MSQEPLASSNEQVRLFVGCGVGEEWTNRVLPMVKKLKSQFSEREIQASWALSENYHLTIVFIGSLPAVKLPDLQAHLTQQARESVPFYLRTKGLGTFPEERAARVLFAQVSKSQPLLDLQSQLESRLVRGGFAVGDDRAYTPHITLAQLRNPKALRSVIEPWLRKDFGKLAINSVTLFRSVQVGPYRKYLPISEHPFEGSAPADTDETF